MQFNTFSQNYNEVFELIIQTVHCLMQSLHSRNRSFLFKQTFELIYPQFFIDFMLKFIDKRLQTFELICDCLYLLAQFMMFVYIRSDYDQLFTQHTISSLSLNI